MNANYYISGVLRTGGPVDDEHATYFAVYRRHADETDEVICHCPSRQQAEYALRQIADIEATGIERYVNYLQQLIDTGDFEGVEVGVMAGAIYCGRDMANRLRYGEGK